MITCTVLWCGGLENIRSHEPQIRTRKGVGIGDSYMEERSWGIMQTLKNRQVDLAYR